MSSYTRTCCTNGKEIDGTWNVNISEEEGKVLPLVQAAMNGHVDCLKMIIEAKANVNSSNAFNYTAVHQACENGDKNCLKILLDEKANINVIHVLNGTPLHIAINKSHQECVNMLLEAKANVNLSKLRFSDTTPLTVAFDKRNIDCMKRLLDCKASIKPLFGKHGFKYAHATRVLLEAKANLCVPCGEDDGITPLHDSVAFGRVNQIHEILDEYHKRNIHSNPTDKYGTTPLMIALYKEYEEDIISMLISDTTEEELLRIRKGVDHFILNS